MARYFHCVFGIGTLLLCGPAMANKVTKLDLKDMQGYADAPVVEVYSSDGEKWDTIDFNKTTHVRLGFDADCRYKGGSNYSAYEGSMLLRNFQIVGNMYPEASGETIAKANHVSADVRLSQGFKKSIIDFDPVGACNAELAHRLALPDAKSKYELLAEGFIVNVPNADQALYTLTCKRITPAGFDGMAFNPASVNARVACKPSAKAKAKLEPPPPPKPKAVKVVAAVQGVDFRILNPAYEGTCPAAIKIDAKITLNYPAEVKYRYVGDKGYKSPVFTLKKKAKGGTWNLAPWVRHVKPAPPAGILALPGGKHKYDYQGWMRVELLSPQARTYPAAQFTVRCHKPSPVVPGGLKNVPIPKPGFPNPAPVHSAQPAGTPPGSRLRMAPQKKQESVPAKAAGQSGIRRVVPGAIRFPQRNERRGAQ